MWYLIVPPIVFILSLALLFWFLSKKRSDPSVQERMTDEGARPVSRRFLFIKEETGLRILEKLTKRINLVFLKFHNRFSQFANLLRERRRKMTEPAAISAETETREKDRFWNRFQKPHTGRHTAAPQEFPSETGKEMPVTEVSGEKATSSESFTDFAREKSGRLREAGKSFGDSLVSKSGEAARVFRRRRMPQSASKRLSEEELIDRIARNPKDAGAYEELGDFYMESGNLSDAKACYRQVIKLSPLNREVKEKVRRLERLLVQKEKTRG